MATAYPRADGVPTAKTFLGHPRGLFMLFFAEMWERFSYYGMRALLVLYLTKQFLFGDAPAYALYGAYTSLIYITPVIGGAIADRYLGARKAVLVGGAFIAVGHFLIALTEGPAGTTGVYLQGFYLALAFIIVGTGFLKANIAVLVGELYPRDDVRRDPAYSIFYMGINLGGFLGPIVCGLLGETVGWKWGFGAAGVGMLAGLVTFVICRPWLGGAGEPREPALLARPSAIGVSTEWSLYLAALAGVLLVWAVLVGALDQIGYGVLGTGVVTLAYVLWRALTGLPRAERDRLFAAVFLLALNPIFWMLFEQAGSSLNIFTDRRVDRNMLGWDVPASLFQSLNSLYIIILAPLFASLWSWLAARRLEPNTAAKFGLGLIFVGAGFLVFVAGALAAGDAMTPVVWVFVIYLLHTVGELCLSPVGLSAMTRLSVASMAGLMMGTWYLAMAGGEYLAGVVAEATAGPGSTPDTVLHVYTRIGWASVGVGIGVALVSPLIKRLMHLDTLGRDDPDHALAGEAQLAEPAAPGTHTRAELRS